MTLAVWSVTCYNISKVYIHEVDHVVEAAPFTATTFPDINYRNVGVIVKSYKYSKSGEEKCPNLGFTCLFYVHYWI